MSSYRSTRYPVNREAEKPPGGFAKSMHGDSLKPGDTVYGVSLCVNSKGVVDVQPQHWGVVVASQGDALTVMYATSEKSYNIAHQQSFSAEDKTLSGGMTKDGHWSRSDFYVIPSELVERRGYVSDKTWDRIESAWHSAARSGSDVQVPSMDRDGTVYDTAQRAVGHWSGISRALEGAAQERSVAAETAGAKVLSDEDRAVLGAKAEAVSFIQEMLRSGPDSAVVNYGQNEASQLAQRILEAPDDAQVVMTPQGKVRLVENDPGLAERKGWAAMPAAEAKEYVQELVTCAKSELSLKQDAATGATAERSSGGPQAEAQGAAPSVELER